MHYGVKGMKWGVRRYQNKDGTLTPKGKKRLAESIYSAANKNSVHERSELEKSIGEDLHKHGVLKTEVIDDLRAKRRAYAELFKPEYDYWDSGEADKDSAKAYKDTYEWFRKNDKKFLDEIIKANGGSKDNLDMYHGFRKAYEGFQDEAWTKGKERFAKSLKAKGVDLKAIEKDQDKAWDEYENACKRATDDIIGVYGNVSVSKFDSSHYLNTDVRRIVTNAIHTQEWWGKDTKNNQ